MMIPYIKTIIRKTFQLLSIDVKRYNLALTEAGIVANILQQLKIDLVLDIGGNVGQFAIGIRAPGYKNNIVSFEPLLQAHQKLKKATVKDSLWLAHDRCAIGDIDGEIIINVSKNSVSSSILPMLKKHSDAAPDSIFQSSELTPIFKLDTLSPQYLKTANNIFIKIDTQGYEWLVLNGATETLDKTKGLLMELSLTPLYDGQHLWKDIVDRLESLGFILWTMMPAFSDIKSGQTLQFDAIFIKNN